VKEFNTQFDSWGMFTCVRAVIENKIIVSFGASEMMMLSKDFFFGYFWSVVDTISVPYDI